MTTIEDTYKELQNFEKKLGFFKTKTKSLSRLKHDFFEKMRSYEYDENIEKAKQYYSYLTRATKLSYSIYDRMYRELQNYNETLATNSINKDEEEAIETITSKEVKEMYVSLNKHQNNYVKQVQDFITEMKNENLLLKLEEVIEIEKDLLEKLGSSHDDIFNNLLIQSKIHKSIEEEKSLSDTIISSIERLNKNTKNFVEKVQDIVKNLSYHLKRSYKNFKNQPLNYMMSPAERAGMTLEKHASVFAATIVALSLSAKIAHLFGFGYIGVMAERTILLLAEVGEGFQSIPFLREMPSNIKSKIQNFTHSVKNSSNNEINNLKQLKSSSVA